MTAPGGEGEGASSRGRLAWFGVWLRGFGMGTAELVPGVSGGTIAFITGIYLELVRSIRGVGLPLLRQVLSGDVRGAWRRGNLGFLVVLGAGMGTAILALARIVGWLLEHRPLELGGFFFGLIAASALFVGRFARPWNGARVFLLGGGAAAGAGVAFLTSLALPVNLLTVFLGGAVAICAWILPGVSGSFVMLLLGLYPSVVAAISGLDVVFLGVLAAGCATGLLLFSRFLAWVLERRYEATLALLAGFMAGSLLTLWPWHLPSAVVDGKPMGLRLLTPGAWSAATGDPSQAGAVAGAMLLGLAIVGALELFSRQTARGTPVGPVPEAPPERVV